jgi:hypothetical protein
VAIALDPERDHIYTGNMNLARIAKCIVAAAAAVFIVMMSRRPRDTSSVAETQQEVSLNQLTGGEQKIQRLIREVHGDAITSEKIFRDAGDVKIRLSFDTNKSRIPSLSVNLSSLARKQKDEGLSDGAVKAGLRF